MLTEHQARSLKHISVEDQTEIARYGDDRLKKILAARRDLDKKTYDRLIIEKALSEKELLERDDLTQQEQLSLAGCELTDADVQAFLAKPELTSDALISLIENEYLSASDLLKKPSLSFVEQQAVVATGAESDKKRLLSYDTLYPETIVRLANTGFFEGSDGKFTDDFLRLVRAPEYQIAFGRSYKKSVLNFLADLPDLCQEAFFVIANNRVLDPEYASIKTKLVLRPDCPLEIPIFFAELPGFVGRFDYTKNAALCRLINVSGLTYACPASRKYEVYTRFKTLLKKHKNLAHPKTTRLPLWSEFTQFDEIKNALLDEKGEIDLSCGVEDLKPHIYSLKELLEKTGYSQYNAMCAEQLLSDPRRAHEIIKPRAILIDIETDDSQFYKEGIYRIQSADGTKAYALITNIYSMNKSSNLLICDIFRDVHVSNDTVNPGYTKLTLYEDYKANPERWAAIRFRNGVAKYLNNNKDKTELNNFNKNREGWLAAHPEITYESLDEQGFIQPIPELPAESEFTICTPVSYMSYARSIPEDIFKDKYSPVFVGWKPGHFEIKGPALRAEPKIDFVKCDPKNNPKPDKTNIRKDTIDYDGH